MTQIVLTDEKEICWKVRMTKDMNLREILEGIEYQFYPKITSSIDKDSKGKK